MQKRSQWTLLLGVVSMFLLTAPAMAQAEGPYWYQNGAPLSGVAERQPFESSGILATNIVGSPVVFTCETEASGFIWNGVESGEGVIDDFSWGPCTTNLPGCSLTGTTSTEEREAEWPITTSKSGEEEFATYEVRIEEVEVKMVGSSFCKSMYGIWGLEPQGTLVGQFNNSTGMLEYINAGELRASSEGPALEWNGEKTFVVNPPFGETLTLE